MQQEASLMWKEKFHCGKNSDESGLTAFLKGKIELKGDHRRSEGQDTYSLGETWS